MLRLFYVLSVVVLVGIGLLGFLSEDFWYLYIIAGAILAIGVYNTFQRKHSVLRNFPVLGYARFFIEFIRPEIHQYLVESDTDGRPFSRERRSIVYQRAKKVLDTNPYGTKREVSETGYQWLSHSLCAKYPAHEDPRILIGGDDCRQPYSAAILNISAMSFGALSKNAVLALNLGAKTGGFYQNTGEGGLTEYHLRYGGDLVWQIGTGYFGCRQPDGKFCPNYFQEKSQLPNVKMIEIKLSQGAKPGHGGILPADKLTPEIAEIRKVPLGHDVLSPPAHAEFSTPVGLLQFVARLRDLSGGKPVGFKLCVGSHQEFFAICKAMLKTKILPDFITVDGGEGGTGAAPLEFSNAVGASLDEGLFFVHNALVGCSLRDKIKIIASGKLITGFEIASKLAMGADLCNSARGMMMALGCIQSLKCHANTCPTGVTTQDPQLARGLVVKDKFKRVANYQRATVHSIKELTGAAGFDHPSQLGPAHINRRVSTNTVKTYAELFPYMTVGQLFSENIPEQYQQDWSVAIADAF